MNTTSPGFHRRPNLGKGLSALISEANRSLSNNYDDNDKQVMFLPLAHVTFNPNQPRKHINYEELEGLATSIKEHGVLQPIIVKKIDGDLYQIIAGERRYHASKKAGLTEIPVIVKNINDSDSFEIALIENVQRQDLSVLEEADAYKKLVEEYGHTQESLSQKIGKSRSYVTNTIRLLRLPEEIKIMVLENKITAGHARAIVNSDDSIQLARSIIENNLNVRDTEKLIQRLNAKNSPQKIKSTVSNEVEEEKDIDIIQMEKDLSASLNAKVSIKIYGKKFTVLIGGNDFTVLDNILMKLSNNAIDL